MRTTLTTLALCTCLTSAAAAQAPTGPAATVEAPEPSAEMHPHLTVGTGRTSAVGHVSEGLVDSTGRTVQLRHNDGLGSVAARATVELPLLRFVSVGGSAALGWWQTEQGKRAGAGTNLTIDVDALIKLRLPLGTHFDFHVVGVIGATLSQWDDGPIHDDLSVKLGGGWNAGGFFGLQWMFSRYVGLFSQVGIVAHFLDHAAHAWDADYHLRVRTTTETFNAGITLSL